MTEKSFSYSKTEKLKSRKLLNQLFQQGKSLNAFPLKLIYSTSPHQLNGQSLGQPNDQSLDQPNNQTLDLTTHTEAAKLLAGVGVSSRNFKKAVDRNRIKRLLRESYRLQKQSLAPLHATEKQWQLFFMYTGKDLPELAIIQVKMQLLMHKLVEQC